MSSSLNQALSAKQHRILLLCVFVVLFGLQAKTCAYQDHSRLTNPIASTKLWLDAHKVGPQSLLPSPEWLRFAVAVVFALSLLLAWRPRLVLPILQPLPQNRFYPERFLRPPPAL
jgi:hypothetical protein